MELQELKEKIRGAKLHPVHVEGSPLDDDSKGRSFIGSIEEYFDALHAVGTPIVLISTEVLAEERFLYSPNDDDELSSEDTEVIDLCSIAAALRGFKKHIGKIAMYKLSAASPNVTLNFFINEAWWLEFIKHWEHATDQVENDLEAAHGKMRADREAEDRKALTALGGLVRDPDFVRLPTQRAMMAYARDKIPELQNVDEFALKNEIQNLNALISAKGLGRKR